MWMAFFQIISHAEKFENKAILLIHFSARYTVKVWWSGSLLFCVFVIIELLTFVLVFYQEIEQAVSVLPSPLAGRVFALTEGI